MDINKILASSDASRQGLLDSVNGQILAPGFLDSVQGLAIGWSAPEAASP